MAISINQEQIVFYHELGRAITQWAHVERALCEISTICLVRDYAKLTSPQYADLYTVFFAIENFRAKTAFADAAFGRRQDFAGNAAEWKLIMASMKKRARLRGTLAHNVATAMPHAPEGRRFCIAPRQIHLEKTPKYPEGSLFLQDITRAQLRFFALSMRLENFQCSLLGRPKLHEASVEQPRDPPTLEHIVGRTLATLSRSPEPPGA